MNLDELRTVQSKERQKDSLQHLRPSFYQEVADYISELKAERERVAAAADDPFSSPEVGRLTDEIETAKDVVEAIYERRMGKLVKQASLTAAGMSGNDEGLTAEEADLFDDLVERIRTNKGRVLDVLADGATTPSDAAPSGPATDVAGSPASAEPTETATADDTPPVPPDEPPRADPPETDAQSADEAGVSVADVMGGDGPPLAADGPADGDPNQATTDGGDGLEKASADGLETTDESHPSSGDDSTDTGAGQRGTVDRLTVRITRDVGSILGVDDREYTLSSDDVVTLPRQNATPLLERDAAEPL
ncbi:hypothetical protein [Natronobiforma cellulositropha]|uniref:hypothetical protein n=1 Tax=Natronobiforma cellulositropha TaxID=1679076 RepID=UPI0021D60DB6|nr:hypothetical protein [Natronobiforma cellulositropha]